MANKPALTTENMKVSKFRNLKFKNEAKLNAWLKINTYFKIGLKDYGQDMLTIWVHETGEILNCDFHSRIYSGKFLDMGRLDVGNYINIWDNEKKRYNVYKKLIIESLI